MGPKLIKSRNYPKFGQVQSLSRVCQIGYGWAVGHGLHLMKFKLCPIFVQMQCDQVADEKINESNICPEIDYEFWEEFEQISKTNVGQKLDVEVTWGQKLDLEGTRVGFGWQNLDKCWTRTYFGHQLDVYWTNTGHGQISDKLWVSYIVMQHRNLLTAENKFHQLTGGTVSPVNHG